MLKDLEPRITGLQLSGNGDIVRVTELTADIAKTASVDRHYIKIGDIDDDKMFNSMLGELRDKSTQALLLSWEGDIIPRGVILNGSRIGWTQNGLLTSSKREIIGTYERLDEFGGESGKLQRMLVFLLPTVNSPQNQG